MTNDFSISLGFDPRQFKDVERYLRDYPKKTRQLIAESMNRAVNAMNTEVRRGISRRYHLTQGQVKAHTAMIKATANKLSCSVTVSDSKKRAWHLWDFRVSPRRAGARSPRVAVLRGGRGARLQHAFVAQMKSGHIGVFERKGTARHPIKELFSPSPAVMASQSVIKKEVEAKGYEVFEKRMDHALDFLAKVRQGR